MTHIKVRLIVSSAAITLMATLQPLKAQPLTAFAPGDLVVTVEGNGSNDASNGTISTGNTGAASATYLDNQAAPLTLYEYSASGSGQTPIGTLELPTTMSGSNSAISGEYGSSSEGLLQLSADGHFLTLASYGVNPTTYNALSDINGSGTALAQSCSLSSGCGTVPQVPRVVAVIGSNGAVDTSTVLYNVFNENNPRSVASPDGKTLYLSGQGVSGDTTEGVFVAKLGSSTATAINTTFDTRSVQIYNGQLYVSQDSKVGTGQTAFIGAVGAGLPTGASTVAPLVNSSDVGIGTGSKNSPTLPGVKVTLNANGNSVNNSSGQIYLSPDQFFYANPTTLYVADTGNPKAGGLGDGGLQKWSFVNGTWLLDYTLSADLNLVPDTATCATTAASTASEEPDCTTGLAALTGELTNNGSQVELFATNYTLGDTNASYLYEITDTLADTLSSQVTGESFTELAEAPADSDFKGVASRPCQSPVRCPFLAWGSLRWALDS